MNVLRRRPRLSLTVVLLALSAFAVGLWMYRHFRLPSIVETFPQGELVVAVDPSYPPFGTIENDALAGLDIDLGKALAETLGLTPRFVMVNFDSAYDAVKTGAVHVALAALRVDNARMGDVFYTWGYLNDGVMLVSREAAISGWDLGGQTVGVVLGSAGHSEARRWSRRVRGMEIGTYMTPAEALDALRRGDVDAAMADAISVREYLRRHPESRFFADYLTVEFYAGAVRNDRRDVLLHLNGAMLTLLNNGTVDTLAARHLGGEPPSARP